MELQLSIWHLLVLVGAGLLGNATTAIGQSTVVRAGAGDRVSLGVGDVMSLSPLKAEDVAQLKLVEHPGYRTPLHVHDRTDESFYVLEGSLTFHAGGKTIILGGVQISTNRNG